MPLDTAVLFKPCSDLISKPQLDLLMLWKFPKGVQKSGGNVAGPFSLTVKSYCTSSKVLSTMES